MEDVGVWAAVATGCTVLGGVLTAVVTGRFKDRSEDRETSARERGEDRALLKEVAGSLALATRALESSAASSRELSSRVDALATRIDGLAGRVEAVLDDALDRRPRRSGGGA